MPSGNQTKVKANLDELERLQKALKKEQYYVKVGIIGSQAQHSHKKSDLENGELGAIHEFGSEKRNIPARSFLWRPLIERMDFQAHIKEWRKVAFKAFIQKTNPKIFYNLLASKAYDIVIEAFATNGYGEWKPLSDTYINREAKKKSKGWKGQLLHKLSRNILVKTGQLRNSIRSKVFRDDK